jgi:alcohol dehydrogenase (cytochrome c)
MRALRRGQPHASQGAAFAPRGRWCLSPGFLALLLAPTLSAQITYDRLLNAAREPQNWLTYSGTYNGRRYSALDQINPRNVKTLEQKWVFQADSLQKFEATPLVVDGIVYVTQAPNDIVTLDARTGRVFWIYYYKPAPDARLCCGLVNRGLAIHGDTLFMGTIDAHLVAVDAKSGKLLWKTQVADYRERYALTLAPLVVKDKVIVGVAGGEFGIRGFLAAYDAKTGKEAWRFHTVPEPGERGHDTWAGDSWMHGGAPIWVTGSYDPELNLTYWGTGNPGPDWNAAQRRGDNLYSDSALALDADTGALKWYFQFSPNDAYDYDAVQIPVLVDAPWNGRARKLMLWANRNGFFYVLDRATGEFLSGHPFIKVTWATGLNDSGRPMVADIPPATPVYPGVQGGTNWYSPSYSPRTGLFYLSAWEDYASIFVARPDEFKPGQFFGAGSPSSPIPGAPNPSLRPAPINNWTEATGHGAVLALDPTTGKRKWTFPMHDVTDSGILTTASDLLFSGSREGHFFALDAKTGALLWKSIVGGPVSAAPITYQFEGKQYVAIAAGHALFAFALRE